MSQSIFRLLLSALLLAPGIARAQKKFSTKTGLITFFSASIIENIEARNQQTAALIDLKTGQLAFSVPIKGFVFKRTLMQEHFNENYLESDKFPKATFSGRIMNFDAVALAAPGPHTVQVEGDLTIHGVTRKISPTAQLEYKPNALGATASFDVAPADYNIEIPLLVRSHLAKSINVKVVLDCAPQ